MSRLFAFSCEALIYAFAFAWPWSVYAYVPHSGLSLATFLAAAIVAFALLDLGRSQRLRVPFELTWPLALFLVVAWGHALIAQSPFPVRLTGYAMLFAAVVQITYTPARALQCLRLTALAGGCVAAVTLLARAGFVLPTVVPLTPEANAIYRDGWWQGLWRAPYLAFATNWRDGTLTFAVCALCGMYFVVARRESTAGRLRALADLVLPAVVVVTAIPWIVGALRGWEPAAPAALGWPQWVLVGAAVWLAARVAAKVEVDRLETHSGAHSAMLFLLGFIALLAALAPDALQVGHVFLFGLAAAYGVPHTAGNAWSGRAVITGALPVLAVVIFNVLFVDPLNTRDPRHYESALRQDIVAGKLDEARTRVRNYETITGDKNRLALWRARIALAADQPQAAALMIHRAVTPIDAPPRPRVLPDVQDREVEAFLGQLRDYVSSAGGDGAVLFAYERALAATGQIESALSLARDRARPAGGDAGDMPAAPMQQAIGALLLQPDTPRTVSDWPANTALAVLTSWGAVIEPAPDGFPEDQLPMVVWGHVSPLGYQMGLCGGPTVSHVTQWGNGPQDIPLTGDRAGRWTLERDSESGAWVARLTVETASGPVQVGHAPLGGLGGLLLDVASGEMPPVPESPVVHVWVP